MNCIAEFRKAKGMTQIYFASLIGISQPYLSEIETGKAIPKVDVLQRIAVAIGCSIDELLHKLVKEA